MWVLLYGAGEVVDGDVRLVVPVAVDQRHRHQWEATPRARACELVLAQRSAVLTLSLEQHAARHVRPRVGGQQRARGGEVGEGALAADAALELAPAQQRLPQQQAWRRRLQLGDARQVVHGGLG